jgi:hypothetical protein
MEKRLSPKSRTWAIENLNSRKNSFSFTSLGIEVQTGAAKTGVVEF